MSSREELKEKIIQHGGIYLDIISPDIDFIVSTYSAVLKCSSKMKEAQEYNVAVVAGLNSK